MLLSEYLYVILRGNPVTRIRVPASDLYHDSKDFSRVKNLSDLAHLLRVSPKGLSYILYKIPSHLKYTKFDVPKKSGGTRTISSPDRRLKFVQTRLAELLYACQREIVPVENNTKKVLSHGFQKKRGLSDPYKCEQAYQSAICTERRSRRLLSFGELRPCTGLLHEEPRFSTIGGLRDSLSAQIVCL